MNIRQKINPKIKPMSTVGIFATLGTLSAGIATTIRYSSIIAERCLEQAQQFTSLLETQLTLPEYAFNVNTHTPDIAANVPVLGTNVDVFVPGQPFNISGMLPSVSLELKNILSSNFEAIVYSVPETIADVCKTSALQAGLAYTLAAAGLFGVLTYAYQTNATLKDRVRHLERNADHHAPLDEPRSQHARIRHARH